ncbi:MAG TPA: serine O-acetyltransferase EpsC [Dongiaceae bacterium]|nr:serine O-acetyltransferase EpsC [Dongiaceae bacterium]
MVRKNKSQVPDPSGGAWPDLRSVVERLRQSREVTNKIRHRGIVRELPSRHELSAVIDDIAAALFPTHYGRSDLTDESIDYFVGATLDRALSDLREQVRRSLFLGAGETVPKDSGAARAGEVVRLFADALPGIRALLVEDLAAAYEGDPAATSISEVLLCYPGFTAIVHYRLAHTLHYLGAPFISRLIASIAHSATGIDIHPAATIGAGFFIDHGTGVVIGETAILGERVRLYQAVTLGARRLPVGDGGKLVKDVKRHPIIEDNVVIYAGATILGRITVGRESVIGGNVWLTHSVPAGSIVTQAQMREVADEDQLTRAAKPNGEASPPHP